MTVTPSRQPQTDGVRPQASPRVLVSICTYNEIENLPRLIEQIEQAAGQVDILVVDDNSPDGTGAWCRQRAARDARLYCLGRENKLGLGTAIVAAMKYAIAHDYDFLLNMDADFSHDPAQVPALIAASQTEGLAADLVIGSRYSPGGRIEGWPLSRHLMSKGINLGARWLLGLTARDCSGGFRCYRVATLARVPFDEIMSRGYSIQEEILWQLKRLGAVVVETPITFVDRQRGRSKISSREAATAAWNLLRMAGRERFRRRPV